MKKGRVEDGSRYLYDSIFLNFLNICFATPRDVFEHTRPKPVMFSMAVGTETGPLFFVRGRTVDLGGGADF